MSHLTDNLSKEIDRLEVMAQMQLKTRNPTVVKITLGDGDPLPEEFEHEKPISVISTEDHVTLWFLKEGHLKRVR